MEFKSLTYLLLLLIYLIIPMALASRQKINFGFRLRYLIPATLFAGAVFVLWDRRFTELGIWQFNPEYITDIRLLHVPVEEWLSFVIIPWSGIFIYEWLKIKIEKFEQARTFVIISLLLFAVLAMLTYTFRTSMFSFFTFFLTAIYLGYVVFRNRFRKHFTKFYLAFGILLIPFLIVSGIMVALPIVTFSSDHIMGTALLGVPFEKIVSLFLLLLINTSIYEYLSERQYY